MDIPRKSYINSNTLSIRQLSLLNNLYKDALLYEDRLNDKCYEFLKSINIPESKLISLKANPNVLIKRTILYILKAGQIDDMFMLPSVPSPNKASLDNMQDYLDNVNAIVNIIQNNITTNFIKNGGPVLANELQKTIKKGNQLMSQGNYGEMKTFLNLLSGANYLNTNNKDIKNITILDTSPKNFGPSIHYDILIEIPFYIKESEAQPETLDKLNIHLEAKRGVQNNYINSNFHLGKFSSTGLSINDNKVYDDLIDKLQNSFHYFLIYGTIGRSVNLEIIDGIYLEWACQYIIWRLKNYFPIFISGNSYDMNFSSEIIKGFMDNPGGKIEVLLKNMLDFVDLNTTGISKNNLYKSTLFDYENKNKEGQNYNQDTWDSYDFKKINYINLQSWGNLIKKHIKISPLFKADVWYGKYK